MIFKVVALMLASTSTSFTVHKDSQLRRPIFDAKEDFAFFDTNYYDRFEDLSLHDVLPNIQQAFSIIHKIFQRIIKTLTDRGFLHSCTLDYGVHHALATYKNPSPEQNLNTNIVSEWLKKEKNKQNFIINNSDALQNLYPYMINPNKWKKCKTNLIKDPIYSDKLERFIRRLHPDALRFLSNTLEDKNHKTNSTNSGIYTDSDIADEFCRVSLKMSKFNFLGCKEIFHEFSLTFLGMTAKMNDFNNSSRVKRVFSNYPGASDDIFEDGIYEEVDGAFVDKNSSESSKKKEIPFLNMVIVPDNSSVKNIDLLKKTTPQAITTACLLALIAYRTFVIPSYPTAGQNSSKGNKGMKGDKRMKESGKMKGDNENNGVSGPIANTGEIGGPLCRTTNPLCNLDDISNALNKVWFESRRREGCLRCSIFQLIFNHPPGALYYLDSYIL